ncbi:choice-of-anchor M domain-containing protein [Actinophytocola algeriensis]|uniref:Surface-anchored protein n=1 Tax=Actinophytocola algeriensis TaxID=1768010 RepID=A0A7W7VFT7_9PSEU|nr:choice-of-anchor M domain-containing protein [Actinophytocola algeriensis]MBB4908712.1 surface-anchored protein [Actinophytocola algeriensis]MBE1474901.1 surface-anchored protein [Actinophytocola algeriensis]
MTVAAAVVVGAAGPASAATVLSTGHVDVVDVDYAGGALTVRLLDGTVSPAVERDPADVELRVLSGAKTTVPNNAAYSFLGTPGSTVWILPQTQNASLLWPGWNSTDVAGGVFQSNTLRFRLTGVTGGQFAIYTTSLGNPTVLFNSRDGLPDSRSLATGAHAHANWAFSNAGTYTITFEVSGVLAASGATVSDQASYTFTVQA